MPIDTTVIEGFESMTAEQKVEALLKVEVPEKIDLSGYVKKDLFDKTASELAEAKKTIKGKMSEDEAAKAQADADRKALEDKYTILKEAGPSMPVEITGLTEVPAAGDLFDAVEDEKLARETAEALFDGNMEKVFENQQKANAAYEKKLRADLVKQDPKPDGAGGGSEEKDEAVEFAKKLGKQRADALKNANEGLKHYF